ncbi:MAG: PHP domain-containing protein [Flavobacteriales bacterium]|nr:PHP domain-containing protein [Flavobacteriales bacterium]
MFINCHSWFSFTHGVMKPDALLEEAARMGVRSFALTDIHCSAGIPDLVRDAPRYGVRPVAGIEFRQGPKLLYIGLARNNDGFQRLNELLSPHLLDDEALPERPPSWRTCSSSTPSPTRHTNCGRTSAWASGRPTSRGCPSRRGGTG